MPNPPTIDNALQALAALRGKDAQLAFDISNAMTEYGSANASTSATGKQRANATILKLRGKGQPYAGWAAAFSAVLQLPPATVRAASWTAPAPDSGILPDFLDGITGKVTDAVTPDWAGGAFSALTSANLWMRVGQVLLGILLITVAASKLAGPTVLKVAKTTKALQ